MDEKWFERILIIAAIVAVAVLFFVNIAYGATVCNIFNGCTGTSTAPSYGQILIGGQNGEYEFVASSTLGGSGGGGSGFSTTSAAYWFTQQTTSGLAEGSNLYFTNARAVSALTGQNISIFNNNAGYLTGNQSVAISGAVSGSGATSITAEFASTTPVQFGGTGSTTLSGILKGNGTSGVQTAVGDTDYQKPISLTTSGSSGAASFSGDVLNIPQYSGTTYTGTYPISISGSSISIVATSTFGCTVSCFASPDISQWTDDAGYVTSSFSTTSAAYWQSVNNFFSTTSASYFLSLNQGPAFSTTSASYFLTQNRGNAFSTTSADYWGGVQGYLTANQTITLSGDVTGSGATSISTAFNLGNSHWWTARQNFTNATTSGFEATSTDIFLDGYTSALLSVNGSHQLTAYAGTSPCSSNQALQSLSALGAGTCVTMASSTALGDNNTFSGTDSFSSTITGSVSGNAGTATTLQNARTINNVSFNGSANITINAASSTALGDNNTFSGGDIFTASSTFLKLIAVLSTTTDSTTTVGSFTTASTTNLTVSSAPSALLLTNSSGSVSAYGGSSNPCSANQAPTTLSALGVLGGCTSTFLTSAVTSVSGTTNQITSSGGNTPTLSLPNLVIFPSAASTTLFSVFNTAYFGGTATSSFDSQGRLTFGGNANLGANTIYGGSFGSGEFITMNGAGGYTLENGNTGYPINFTSDYVDLLPGGEGKTQLVLDNDTSLSRQAADILDLGNGTYQDTSGSLRLFAASSSLASVFTKLYVGGTATTTIDSAGNIVIPSGSSLTNTGVSNGCATWATGVLGTTGTACGSGGGGGITAIGNYATTSGTTISFSTSTETTNGVTQGIDIVASANGVLFTPTISGTLSNGGLAHSTIVLNGTTLTLGDTSDTITAASSSLLGDNNTFSGNDTFNDTIAGSINGNANTATTLQTPRTINGVSFNGSANIVVASTTLLADNNTFSGTETFSGNDTFTASTTMQKQLNLVGASSTVFSVSGEAYFGTASTSNLTISNIQSALLLNGSTGITGAYGGSSDPCSTNQAPTTFSASGALGGCTSTFLTSAVTSVSGTANEITSSGGNTPTLSLPNLVLFPNEASSTLFSVFGTSYFGGTATTTINSAGNISAQQATTTALADKALASSLALTDSSGDFENYGGASDPCTNQLPTTISALGALGGCTSVSNAMLSNDTISGITLGNNLDTLSATANAGLTFSGNYNGSANDTVGLTTTSLSTNALTAWSGSALEATATPELTIGYLNGTTSAATSTIASALMIGNAANNGYLFGTSTLLQLSTSTNNFTQEVLQDTNTGSDASADYVAGGNLMTNTTYYGEFGCDGSNYSNSSFTGEAANDCWVTSSDSNLDLEAASTTGAFGINFFTGGVLTADKRMSISSSGTVTINGIGSGAVSAASGVLSAGTLSLANGGTNASLTGASGIVAMNSGNTALTIPSTSYTLTSLLLTAPNASTTDLTASSFFQMPSASNPSPTNVAACSQSTNSPYQIHCGNNAGGTSVYDDRTGVSFLISSTTAMTASTSETVAVPTGFTATSGQCTVQPVGATAEIEWGYANPTSYVSSTPVYWNASSTPGQEAIASNNTPATNATSTLIVGNFTGSPISVACNFFGAITGI
jgi:hypothetical protein